jgi:hypothetical protein
MEVVEAWRSLRGLPVYEIGPEGHATHFYGALVPWVQGEIFRWVGPNNRSGRVLTLLSALATITLIAASMRTKGSGWTMIVAWAALLGLNHRTLQYYSENRPDMTAMFLTTAAVLLMALGLERRRWSWLLAGTVCLIAGFFFKQTAAPFAAVPMIVLALRGRRPARIEVLLALAPLAAMGAVLASLRSFPAIYHYMIEVPRLYRVDWPRAANHFREFLLESPLFVVLIGEWLIADRGSLRKDARMPWLIATLAVAVPSCAVAQAKVGGAPNSMLPALLAMWAFCALRMPGALAWLEGRATSAGGRVVLGGFAAVLVLLTVFPRLYPVTGRPPWDVTYDGAVAAVSRLPGTVVCPEDPTIPLFAKSYAGRGLFAEMDAHPNAGALPEDLPAPIVDELRAADYVVDIRDYWFDHLEDRHLRELGFEPADGVAGEPPPYRIWRRGELGAARAAWNR